MSTDSALSPSPSPGVGVGETLRDAATALSRAGSETPRLDAELLLAHVLGLSRTELYTDVDRPLDAEELAAFETLLARRAAHEPIAYTARGGAAATCIRRHRRTQLGGSRAR